MERLYLAGAAAHPGAACTALQGGRVPGLHEMAGSRDSLPMSRTLRHDDVIVVGYPTSGRQPTGRRRRLLL